MDQSPENISRLWQLYIAGKASQEELKELFRLNEANADAAEYSVLVEQALAQHPGGEDMDERVRNELLQEILNESAAVRSVRPLFRWRWIAAAVVLLLAMVAGVMYFRFNTGEEVYAAGLMNVAPGKQGAVLTLGDGSQVVLDSLENGIVATQNGTQLTLEDGGLTYAPSGSANDGLLYNTMTTPKGRQFRLTLPDGSRVWLNAASSIRYPTAFAGHERKVVVTGEAYFEVAQEAGKSFRVIAGNGVEIAVLGTHFNVNAYENEASTNITLLEGSVRVSADAGRAVTLRPGQQAQLANKPAFSGIKVVEQADVDEVLGWKNGVFIFDNASLEEVMRQLERWYDITIVYEKDIPQTLYYGKISRQNSLQEVLHILEKNEVRFRLENGNRLVVTQ